MARNMMVRKGRSAKLGCFVVFLVEISNDHYRGDSSRRFAARPRAHLAQAHRNLVVDDIVSKLIDPFFPSEYDDDDYLVLGDDDDSAIPTEYPLHTPFPTWQEHFTPAPFSPSPVDTPAPIATAASMTPSPVETPAPIIVETPAPIMETPAPIMETPSPVETPAPIMETPSPVETPAPIMETPSPVTPSPVEMHAPIVETPSPVTPSPVEMHAPTVEAPSPVTPSPVETPAPIVETPSPVTPSPVEMHAPTVEAPSPVTPSPVETPAPVEIFVPITSVPMTSQPTIYEPMVSEPTTSEPSTSEHTTTFHNPATSEPTTNWPTHLRYEPMEETLAPTIHKPTTAQPSTEFSYHHFVTQPPTTFTTHKSTTVKPSIEIYYHPSASQPPITLVSIPPSRSSQGFLSGVLNFSLPLDRLSGPQQVSGLPLSQVVFFEETAEEFLRIRMNFYNRTLSFSDFSVTVAKQLLPQEQLGPFDKLILRRLEESSLIIVADIIAIASPAEAAIQFPFQEILYGVFVEYSDDFRDMLFSSKEFGVYSPIRGGGSTDNAVVLGGSLAGIAVVISLLVATFVIIRQRHRNQKHEEKAHCVTPTSVSSRIESGELRVSRIDPDDLHFKKASQVPVDTLLSKSVTASDEWSICDEDLMHSSNFMPRSLMTDSGDSLAASSFELDKEVYQESGSVLLSVHEDLVISSQTTNTCKGLYERSETREHVMNDTDAPSNMEGNIYQVRAPSGPLGIVIEASKAGPIVRKVKECSPLYNLVEPGDVIHSIDGVDCRAMDAHMLAEWIAAKPWVPEHVLELFGDADARSLCSSLLFGEDM